MGTTQSSIARIEGGGSLPTLGMLARLAHATGTPQRLAAPESPTLTSAEPPDQIHAARLPAPHEPTRPAFPPPTHGRCGRMPTVSDGCAAREEGNEGRRKEDTGTLSDSHARGRVFGSVSPWPTGQILMKRRMPERLMWDS